MNKPLFLKAFILLGLLCLQMNALAHVDELSARLMRAYEKGEPIPNLSREASIDMSSAYQIQAAYVKKRLTKDAVAGFKAGLTNSDAQAHFGINRPIFGVLLKSGDFSHLKEIPLKKYHYLMVETELGFITKKPITQTVNSISELKGYIGEVVPVIEIPDVGFALSPITAPDLVAGNTGSTGYIIHRGINWYGDNINSLTVSLIHDGVIVNQGQGEDAMGDQWEALRWLVNQVIAHGWSIEKGNLLITGALGEMVPAKSGLYRAQFDDGAAIEFTFS
jgi:2-keto-4-pentenoate hydratase